MGPVSCGAEVVSFLLEFEVAVPHLRPARRYRTVQIRAGRQILTAADPLPDDLAEALAKINSHDVH